MNILFIVSTDPRETSYGGQQRTHVLWNALRSVGDVWTVVPVPHREMEVRDEDNRIYKLCLERRYSLGWFVARLLLKLNLPITFSWGMTLRPIQELGVKFDVSVARYVRMAGLTQPWRFAPMHVDVDDTPSVEYALAYPKNRLRKGIVERWQKAVLRHALTGWVPDVLQIPKLKPCRGVCVPNIPLVSAASKKSTCANCSNDALSRETLLFVGYMAHYPNQVAVDWFLKTYWTDLKREFPNLRYRIVGGGLPEQYKSVWSAFPGVEIAGYVENLDDSYNGACAVLTPMRIGSGSCIKVLEALARGMPVVSTEQGLRGISPEDRIAKHGIFEFSDLGSLISCLNLIRENPSLGRGARDYIQQHFTQQAVNDITRRTMGVV